MNPQRIIVARAPRAWWQHDGEFATEPGKLININGSVVAVDPAYTSPNVFVAIRTQPGEEPITLRPGETVVFPRTVRQIYVSNPLIAQLDLITDATNTMTAVVALLTGSTADLVAWKARANHTRAVPSASKIAAGLLAVAEPTGSGVNSFGFVSHGLEFVRVILHPLDAAGALIDPPADFAASVIPWTRRRLPMDAADVVDVGLLQTNMDLDSGTYPAAFQKVSAWRADIANALVVAQYQTVFDLEVGHGGHVALQLTGLAGSNVSSILACVEGF